MASAGECCLLTDKMLRNNLQLRVESTDVGGQGVERKTMWLTHYSRNNKIGSPQEAVCLVSNFIAKGACAATVFHKSRMRNSYSR